jgi:ferredoxin-fold anticodon binding domain-containing protein
MEQMETLVGKDVKVIRKNGGYTKVGVLRQITNGFIVLQLFNGRTEVITFDGIEAIKETSLVGRCGINGTNRD